MSAATLLLAVLLLCPRLGAQESKEQAPSFSSDSIVNSADGSPLSLAPNVLATVYGLNLAYTTETAVLGLGSADLPRELGQIRVSIGGVAAPILYASPTQINFLIPADLVPGKTNLLVLRQASAHGAQINLADVAPALFLVEGGRLAATHADGSLITEESPALPGEIIVVYGDGLGLTKPKQVGGAIPSAAARLVFIDQFRVFFDEQRLPPEDVLYAGLTPGYPGLYQVNLRLPAVIMTKKPLLRVGFEQQMSQNGLPLEVATSLPY